MNIQPQILDSDSDCSFNPFTALVRVVVDYSDTPFSRTSLRNKKNSQIFFSFFVKGPDKGFLTNEVKNSVTVTLNKCIAIVNLEHPAGEQISFSTFLINTKTLKITKY